jgi:hypothetical protein
MKLAKKKEDVWEPKRPYVHMPGYVSVKTFLEVFNRGLEGHFARSSLFGQNQETFHIEDLAFQAEFYAENFAMILSSLNWKDSVDGE